MRLRMISPGPNRIEIIKHVRNWTRVGLQNSAALIHGPMPVELPMSDDPQGFFERLQRAGAVVEIIDANATDELAAALTDWKDAGGDVQRVVRALDDYIRRELQR